MEKMLKTFVIFAIFSTSIFCGSPEEFRVDERKSLCDLNSFTCKCGDIDVVNCRCIEWSKNCPEDYVYDEESCGCKVEINQNNAFVAETRDDNAETFEEFEGPAQKTHLNDNEESFNFNEKSRNQETAKEDHKIMPRGRKPAELMKKDEKFTTRPIETSKSHSKSSIGSSEQSKEEQKTTPTEVNAGSSSNKESTTESKKLLEERFDGFKENSSEPSFNLVHPKTSASSDSSHFSHDSMETSNSKSVQLSSETDLEVIESESESTNFESDSKNSVHSSINSEPTTNSELHSTSISSSHSKAHHGFIEMPSHYGSHTIIKTKFESSSSSENINEESISSNFNALTSSELSSSLILDNSIPSASSDMNQSSSDLESTLSDQVPISSDDSITTTFTSSSNDSCYIPECRSCDELDEENCICYQVEMECLPGYKISPDGCECVRDNTTSISDVCPGLICTDGLSVNEAFCNCSHKICPSTELCEDEFLLNLETCDCVCGLREWNCQKGFVINHEKCECEPPKCTPHFPCPDGTHWNFDLCTCSCSNPPNCTSDRYVVDAYSCKCVCANQQCDEGFIADDVTCECVPDHEPECPPKFVYDPLLCRCICQAYHDCPFNFEWDESQCKCVCPKSVICDADFIWSDQHCDCMCNVNKTCQPNFVFDDKKCDCICDPKLNDDVCQVGHVFDKRICDCVKGARPHCPTGFVYSEEHCDCVCAVVDKCTGKGIFSHDTCKCACLEENVECEFGIFDEEECDCVSGLPIDFFGGNWNED